MIRYHPDGETVILKFTVKPDDGHVWDYWAKINEVNPPDGALAKQTFLCVLIRVFFFYNLHLARKNEISYPVCPFIQRKKGESLSKHNRTASPVEANTLHYYQMSNTMKFK